MTTLTITKKTPKPFQADDGGTINYFWYKALRKDGVTIDFGSRDGEKEVNDEVEVNLEKTERSGGKFGYKEILPEGWGE